MTTTDTEVVNFIETPDGRLNDYVEEKYRGESCGLTVPSLKTPSRTWFCTRPKGHDGEHEAWGLGQLVAVWETRTRAETAARGSVDQYEWDTVCTNCNRDLGKHLGWACLTGDQEYAGPLRRRGTASNEANQAADSSPAPERHQRADGRVYYNFLDAQDTPAYLGDAVTGKRLALGRPGMPIVLDHQHALWLLCRLEEFVNNGKLS